MLTGSRRFGGWSFAVNMRHQPLFRVVSPSSLKLAFTAALALACSASVRSQSSSTPDPSAKSTTSQTSDAQSKSNSESGGSGQEVVTRDSSTTFKVRVNLVQVRVVVRDEHGKIIDNLKKEDFQLFDNRKPQTITTFNVETPLSHAVPVVSVSDRESDPDASDQLLPNLPQRFVSLFFDDIHLEMSDAVTVRAAGTKILEAMGPADRVGIYTSSGQVTQEFTADRELVKRALTQIMPRPVNSGAGFHECPEITYYQADLIENQNNDQALSVATEDAVQCAFNGDETKRSTALAMARSAAARALSNGDMSSTYAYQHLSDALRRLSAMPGQRKMVFVSPGFILSTLLAERSDVIDRSTRAGVVIDTLDARGLYTPDVMGDIADPPADSFRTAGFKSSYRVAAQSAQTDILADFAAGTGGTFFHNRNDLDVALRQAIAAPSTSYVLGFSPQNLKLNGSFHALKVSLTGKQKFTVQARRGYYAPRNIKNPEDAAKEEIQEAVFSQEEIRDLAVELQTQFFRRDATAARLSVLAHVDLKGLKFRKVEDRNHDNLTLATVIFDENGNYVAGGEKILEMKLRDATLQRLDRSGITVKSSFDVKPGNYLVRLVVREREGELMAARNGAVVIPY
jgi:VWFA-related protein